MRLLALLAFLIPYFSHTLLPTHSGSIVQLYNKHTGHGGTGYEVTYKGHDFIMTNAHVCELKDDKGDLTAIAPFLPPTQVHVVKVAEGMGDLCLVSPLKQLPPLTLGNQELHLFEHFYVSGYPRLGPLRQDAGVADREVDLEIEGTNRSGVVAFVAIEPGSSGSPVFNDKNEVVGTIFAGNMFGMAVYVPLHLMTELLDGQLKAH